MTLKLIYCERFSKDNASTSLCMVYRNFKGMKSVKRDGNNIIQGRESVQIFSIIIFLKLWKK